MRVTRASPVWWRIDGDPHDAWTWDGFPLPRHRFDPASGRFRVRHAASDPVAAARERFPAKRLTTGDAGLWLVRLQAPPAALHLTHQANLDALGLDDRISTGRVDRPTDGTVDPLLVVGQELADAVHEWWGGAPPPIVYRTRSVPAQRSMAFAGHHQWGGTMSRPLREARALFVSLITDHGFDLPDAWL